MALDTVQDYVNGARVLLQDADAPYRYPDADLVAALSYAMLEARKLRPDLFLGSSSVPSYPTNDTTAVNIDEQYRVAVLYYIVGQAQLRDDETTQDTRAAAFLAKFTSALTALG